MFPLPECYFASYPHQVFGPTVAIQAEALTWMETLPETCLHAIVTDPPYTLKEYTLDEISRREEGRGGVWRIPPTFDGCRRAPLPRFTVLTTADLHRLETFFYQWGQLAHRVLLPGGHVFLSTTPMVSPMIFAALVRAGLEFRGQIIRLVRTLRGGDRPRQAEKEFPLTCSLPRACHEPWGLFRRPLPRGMTVGECLRRFQTGALRRLPDGRPFADVIPDGRTPILERRLAPHPSLKPQSFLRRIVYAALPLGVGVVLDPFMGSGSTLAAAWAVGYAAVGTEYHAPWYRLSCQAIPALSRLSVQGYSP
jgi:site-specific DNA-methyltransferase (adenine-specific)